MRFKHACKRLAPWLLMLVLLAGLAAVHGLAANYDIGYEITNGDFQNYNPVRRLLAGQAPYGDFTVYLGAGELYSVAAVLLFIGNSFGRSMFASNFCTWLYFELLVLACCIVVLGSGKYARRLTAALSAYFLLVAHDVAVPLAGVAAPLISYAARNGTSARMIRAAAMPLLLLLAAAGLRWWQRRQGTPRTLRIFPLHPLVLIPLLAGALVPWSNDMGAALYISSALAFGLYLIRVYKTNIRQIIYKTLMFIGVSILGLGASVMVVSRCHPIAWLQQARGTSAFQPWYYGTSADAKLYNLGDISLSPYFWLCLAAAVGFAVGIFRCKAPRSAVLAAGGFTLALGMPLWNLLYCVLSAVEVGPDGGVMLLAAIFVPAAAVRGLLLLAQRTAGQQALKIGGYACGAASVVLAGGVLVYGGVQQVAMRIGGHGEGTTYVAALGGWTGEQAQKLETEQSILQGAGGRVFSTYASALEAMTGQFQPTGTDYIIHVLGDWQRLEYLQAFQQGDFDLVQTPSVKVAPTERWCRNANWWFYRELYRYWAPVNTTYACGGMHLFWQRTGVDNDLAQGTSAELIPGENGAVTVKITADDPDFCGVADVTLEYSVTGGGLTGSFLHVTAVTENELCAAAGRDTNAGDFFIPTDRETYYVPVTIANGTGVITLEPQPANAALELHSATVNATYTDWTYFYE